MSRRLPRLRRESRPATCPWRAAGRSGARARGAARSRSRRRRRRATRRTPTRVRSRSAERGAPSYSTKVGGLSSIAADPAAAALFLDVDGVLAPIVERPSDARVPDETRAELRRLAGRYALVAVVTGRPSTAAQAIVGVRELRYAG